MGVAAEVVKFVQDGSDGMRIDFGVGHWGVCGVNADDIARDALGSWDVWAEDDLVSNCRKEMR